ncbi:hypothetical protein Taro_033591 [Colocasia esculenta]|uniref:F-box domain-containing protein n=1 Tax=Colocasia esculenta TaxID=4460 RepID=A0A843WCX5_COLES|nr:hypothetical protein [Colocasia esculenta]
MDDLPPPILVEILSRLADAGDLASCRLVSPALRSLSYDVRAVTMLCSRDRALRSLAPDTRPLVVPFRSTVANLVSLLPRLESLTLGVEDPSSGIDISGEFDDSDDLHLTDVEFLSRWLPGAGARLRALSISDLWLQSCWRPSEVLDLVSDCCERLLALELKNAWLSVKGLRPMPLLASLTLEFIRLEDEHLDGLSASFPSLETLNLIGVGGLSEPNIRLPRLKTCRWTVSQVPLSVTIRAPELADLDLLCVRPRVLSLRTPSLRRLRLKMKQVAVVEADRFPHLRSVRLEASSGLCDLLRALAGCEAVKKAEVEVPGSGDGTSEAAEPVAMGDLAGSFPLLDELELGPGAWRELERSAAGGAAPAPLWRRRLKTLTVHLPTPVLRSAAPLSSVVAMCGPPCEVVVLAHGEDAGQPMERLVSLCGGGLPGVKWRWGICGAGASKGLFCNCEH